MIKSLSRLYQLLEWKMRALDESEEELSYLLIHLRFGGSKLIKNFYRLPRLFKREGR